jgi:hypothetical protein
MLGKVSGDQHVGAGRPFVAGASVVLILLNEARRILARLTGRSGLSSGESLVVTLLALGGVAEALKDAAPAVSRPAAPSAVVS